MGSVELVLRILLFFVSYNTWHAKHRDASVAALAQLGAETPAHISGFMAQDVLQNPFSLHRRS